MIPDAFTALVESIVDRRMAEREAAAKPDEYLSTRDAAAVADVSTKTIRRWATAGRLKEHRAGRELRFRRVDVEYMLASSRRVPTEKPASIDDLVRKMAAGIK